jgi:hypothetical protein
MVKCYDYMYDQKQPFALREVNFVSDTLSPEEIKVFEAWDRNAVQYPVKVK